MNGAPDREHIFFGSLGDPEYQAIFSIARRVEFDKGHLLIRQGQVHSSLCLVAEGQLEVLRTVENHDQVVGRLEKGNFFGEIGFFDPGPASASVRAVTKGLAYEIRKSDFQELVKKNPAAGCAMLTAMMKEMARRLRRLNLRLGGSVLSEGLSIANA